MAINVSIYTRHSMGIYREVPGCLMTGTLSSAASSLRYYRGPDCRYTDAWATLQNVCDTCQGAGSVAKKRPVFTRKPCPTCKGVEKPETYISLEEIEALVRGEETPCPMREDGTHCVHWYDGDHPCCACGDNSGAQEERKS